MIGLLGGVASGKSVVANLLRQLGAVILDADQAGHEVLRLPSVKDAARQRWGAGIFGSSGEIDRKALAAIVFDPRDGQRQELQALERITHPEIGRRVLAQAESLRGAGAPLLVLDAPVMLKVGWDQLCDELLFVDAPREVRLSRALARGWTEAEFAAREAAQEPVELKRSLADRVLDNSGEMSYTFEQVKRLWQEWVG